MYGSRKGHFNRAAVVAAAAKRKQPHGVIRVAELGVLAAARVAVSSKRIRLARAQASGGAPLCAGEVHAGVGTEPTRLWSGALNKFQQRTILNIAGVTQLRAHPGAAFENSPGMNLGAQRAARTEPLARTHPRNRFALLGVDCPV